MIQVDALSKGLGASFIQEGKPIVFTSKSLTNMEQRTPAACDSSKTMSNSTHFHDQNYILIVEYYSKYHSYVDSECSPVKK